MYTEYCWLEGDAPGGRSWSGPGPKGGGGVYGPQNGHTEQCALSVREAPKILFFAPGTGRSFVFTTCVYTQNAQIFHEISKTHKATSCFCWCPCMGTRQLKQFCLPFFLTPMVRCGFSSWGRRRYFERYLVGGMPPTAPERCTAMVQGPQRQRNKDFLWSFSIQHWVVHQFVTGTIIGDFIL